MRFNQKRAKYWQRHVEAFGESELTRRAYCQKNRIKLYPLDYWRRKFKESSTNGNPDRKDDWIAIQIPEDHQAAQSRFHNFAHRFTFIQPSTSSSYDQLFAES